MRVARAWRVDFRIKRAKGGMMGTMHANAARWRILHLGGRAPADEIKGQIRTKVARTP